MQARQRAGARLLRELFHAVARPIAAPAQFVAVHAESENLSLQPGALLAGSVHCIACGRTPLVGETVTVHRADGADACACDVCLGSSRADKIGEPFRRDGVRTTGGALTVRRIG